MNWKQKMVVVAGSVVLAIGNSAIVATAYAPSTTLIVGVVSLLGGLIWFGKPKIQKA